MPKKAADRGDHAFSSLERQLLFTVFVIHGILVVSNNFERL